MEEKTTSPHINQVTSSQQYATILEGIGRFRITSAAVGFLSPDDGQNQIRKSRQRRSRRRTKNSLKNQPKPSARWLLVQKDAERLKEAISGDGGGTCPSIHLRHRREHGAQPRPLRHSFPAPGIAVPIFPE
jgi:hypothetical protein